MPGWDRASCSSHRLRTGSAGDTDALLAALRRRLPRYMVPLAVEWRDALPRNANGKFDRTLLRQELTAVLRRGRTAASRMATP